LNSDWLQTVYIDLLSRKPDTNNAGYKQQIATLAKAHTPTQVAAARYSVALGILKTAEYRGDLIAGFFNRYVITSEPLTDTQNSFADAQIDLYKFPFDSNIVTNNDATAVNNFVKAMASGASQQAVLAQILVGNFMFVKVDNLGQVVSPVLNYLLNPHPFP
jgi:hypothetical protein